MLAWFLPPKCSLEVRDGGYAEEQRALKSSEQLHKPGIYSQDSHLWLGACGTGLGGSGVRDGMWHRGAGAHLPRGCHSRGSVPKEPHEVDTAQPQWPQLPPAAHGYSSAINVYDRRERK